MTSYQSKQTSLAEKQPSKSFKDRNSIRQLKSYKRILLKLSGEMLASDLKYGLNIPTLHSFAKEILELSKMNIEIAIVIGGGNIVRGARVADGGIDRVTADYMGIMATIINGLALQDILEKNGLVTRLQTAIEVKSIAEPFIRRKAIRHLEKKRIVILAGGTGNPYFTTDTTAVLRAIELGADVIIKATKVDGVYDADPLIDKQAKRFSYISFSEIIKKQLKIMDPTAFTLCKENQIPIFVCQLKDKQLQKTLKNNTAGTLIYSYEGFEYYGSDR